ncbi:uncharacterized oxidoreductase YoxD-like [Musca autumnalis]|uniref:uncharacterized oxidoreductase YoxD-like n=1 Tax=Musca autumnalis TaxID=221902 RepID=UPI003CF852F5
MNKRIILIEAIYSIYLLPHILFYLPALVISIVVQIIKWLKNILKKRPIDKLIGEVALITGSGRGLGREIAIALAKLGCHIAIVDIQENLAEETANYISGSYNVKTKFYKVDIRDYQQLLDLQKRVTADLGDVTILVNNAGIITLSSIDNPPAQEVQRMIDVNFTAPILTTQIFLPKMKELNRGYIVNISSLTAMYPHPIYNVYAASKAASRNLTSSLRIDLLASHSKVRAITICPFFLTTNKRVNDLVKALKLDRLMYDLDGEIVAEYIIDAILRGDDEVTVPRNFALATRLLASLPVFVFENIAGIIGKICAHQIKDPKIGKILQTDDGVPINTVKINGNYL